jgi:hypothetical protein
MKHPLKNEFELNGPEIRTWESITRVVGSKRQAQSFNLIKNLLSDEF